MNKYRDKSDFEINKAVADNYLPCDYRYNENDKIVELIGIDLSCEFGSCIDIEKEHVYGKFDPCNNPADAMPIVIENGICMNYIDKDIGWGARHFDEEKGELEIYDKHYYRAAMICFLMMKDAENEK
ncbi:phage protein NinX family protein [Morganella morganii]|uniref:phage protein NinX family protein n=1 Tax=Morganella morganii TaxID=582 RepID=UPI003EB80434